jgi:hypothetical protein
LKRNQLSRNLPDVRISSNYSPTETPTFDTSMASPIAQHPRPEANRWDVVALDKNFPRPTGSNGVISKTALYLHPTKASNPGGMAGVIVGPEGAETVETKHDDATKSKLFTPQSKG